MRHSPARPNPKAQIEAVLAQRQTLKAQLLDSQKTHLLKGLRYGPYAEQIKRLDVGKCPPDFQQPWFDLCGGFRASHAHDQDADLERVSKALSAAAVVHTGGAALLALPGLASPTTKAQRSQELLQRLEDAWFKVERLCLNYSIRAQR